MKFLHAADIHLDSPLTGLARRADDASIPERVTRDCTRRAFENLIALAIEEDVAFVLIAGDLYDRDWRDFSTGLFFAEQMRRLGRPCVMVSGNHDAASVISKKLTLPPNVHLMSSRKVDTWRSDELGVVVHGRSFPDRHIAEDLSADYPGPEPGRLSIAMLHTSAEDPGAHEVYAPCSVQALAAGGYDYWALGHIHDRRVLHEKPWIVFPGNTQGRHARETGAKGATLVEEQDGRIVRIDHRATDVLRWACLHVDLAGAETMAEAATRLRFELAPLSETADARPMLVRVILHGETALHARFVADPAAIEAECRGAAVLAPGEVFIERVLIETRMPARAGAGADAELEQAFARALDDPALTARLLDEFAKLRAELPRIPGRAEAVDLPTDIEALRALLPDAWQLASRAMANGDAP